MRICIYIQDGSDWVELTDVDGDENGEGGGEQLIYDERLKQALNTLRKGVKEVKNGDENQKAN